MKYRKIYISLWLNSVKLVTNYKNEKADITAGRHLHGLSRHSTSWINFTWTRKWKGHFFAGYTKELLGTADVLVSATSMVLDIDQVFSTNIAFSYNLPIGKSVWNICRRQLGMVIRTKPSARP